MAGNASSIVVHENDLPAGLNWAGAVAVDTETMGLSLARDRLCLVQLSAGDGSAHLVRFGPSARDATLAAIEAPNLVRLLADPKIVKIFHYARFDLAMIRRSLGVYCAPVFCTKIASKLVRTFTDRHGLKDLCRDLLGIELSKQQQSSDWGAAALTAEQIAYAASDVLHLHALREKLVAMLAREDRTALANACFEFLATRSELDLCGWNEEDIFAH